MKRFAFILTLLLSSLPLVSQAIETAASHAFMMDADTETVLLEKNADELMHPSSMSKLMTVYMVFDRLKQGTLSLDDRFTVSEKAWRMQGSKMFVHVGDRVRVEDLLRGIIVQSGNDACIVVAEGLMGSEEAFANAMNKKAQELGLTKSHFVNSTGWPDPKHLMTSRDLAILAKRLANDFPQYYKYFSEKDFTYSGIRQENRNMLLSRDLGVDGLKTGHTEEAGYGITLSSQKNGRRLILVINGTAGTVARAKEAEYLLQYGFLNFDNVTIFKKGDKVEEVPVWEGKEKTVPLTVGSDVVFTLPKSMADKVSARLSYKSPVPAPVEKDSAIASLVVSVPGAAAKTFPLIAAGEVERQSYFSRLLTHFQYYFLGYKP